MTTNRSILGFVAYLLSGLLTRGNIALLMAVAVVGLLGLSGGFGQAAPSTLTKASAVDASGAYTPDIDAKAYRVQVGRSRSVDGKIEVPMRITITGGQPMNGSWDLNNAFTLEGVEGYPTFERAADPFPRSVLTLSPGVTTEIVGVWPDSPGEKTLVINSLIWRASSLDGSMQWLDPTPVAQVTVR
ncbi:hypothetical protein WG936_10675 [Corynebacterium sp. H127]|uniref:hypothetical protein n=1 Tax=Corynebacterium sp. H127 TaxID=3133418 RepID=UPI0030B31E56